jgi:hypothetical protein
MQTNQCVYRLGAVGRLLSTDCCRRDARFTVVETPQRGDPSSQRLGIGGVSVKEASVPWHVEYKRALDHYEQFSRFAWETFGGESVG